MSSLLKWARSAVRKAPSPPMRFPTSGFPVVASDECLEEESNERFKTARYYPVNIGDIFASKYQVVGKLGWGVTSTVWLARDLLAHQHVTLKIYAHNEDIENEFGIYQHLMKVKAKSWHPGTDYVRTALNIFVIPRPGGGHNCLVQKPMWESWNDLLYRIPSGCFTEDLLKASLKQLFLALDYLHTECNIVHTDIKGDNVLHSINDETLLTDFVAAEMKDPSPRKIVDGIPVYASRRFGYPKAHGIAVLSDFGSAVRGEEKRNHNAGPDIYRAPEVMIKADWSYPVDIWNVCVMVWDLFEGKHMFQGQDQDGSGYTTRAHLAEVIGILGPPPLDLLKGGLRSGEWFHEDGKWKADVEIPQDTSLEKSEERLEEGENKVMFMKFMRSMLQWRPEDRKTAKELFDDPWLNGKV